MDYETDYVEANPDWHLEDADDKVADVRTTLDRIGLSPRSICDIGCGIGAVLEELHNELGATLSVGYDFSHRAIELAKRRSKPGLTFVAGDAADNPERFDVMLVLDVVEHVPDPVAFMRSIQHKAPVAILNIPLELTALKVMSAESLVRGRRTLGHIHYFNEAVAKEMLHEAGYTVRDAWISPPGIARQVVGKRRLLRAAQRGAAALSPQWAARTLGGCSLMIVADSPTAQTTS